MHGFRLGKPSPAMGVAVLALTVALGGTAAAAFGPFNGNQIIKMRSLSGNRLKNHTITGNQINLSKLGKVPSAAAADIASTAGTANTANVANTANIAKTANTANNANTLGGVAPGGFQPAVRWALVKADGSGIIAQSGGISVASHFSGGYYLDFGSSIEGHAVTVTESHANNSGGGGGAGVSPCGGNGSGAPPDASVCSATGTNDANHLFVFTTNGVGTQTDEPFYIVVY